jgi:hypothetical protein
MLSNSVTTECDICGRDPYPLSYPKPPLHKVRAGLLACSVCKCILEQLQAAVGPVARMHAGAEVFNSFNHDRADAILREANFHDSEIDDAYAQAKRIQTAASGFWNSASLPGVVRDNLERAGHTPEEVSSAFELYSRDRAKLSARIATYGAPEYGTVRS